MTRKDWLTSTSPIDMLLPFPNRWVSDRKLRLFVTAWCRLVSCEVLPALGGVEEVLELSERCADGQARLEQLHERSRAILEPELLPPDNAELSFMLMLLGFPEPLFSVYHINRPDLNAESANLLRCVVGTPFPKEEARPRAWGQRLLSVLAQMAGGSPHRPAPVEVPFVKPSIEPEWRSEGAVGLARGVYDERAFERLPVLADALEDAGCTDADVLGHCRGAGPHTRGCWVVDLVLGKE